MSDSVTDVELDRLLKRAKVVDALGVKIAKAIELIDGVLDDLGSVLLGARSKPKMDFYEY